MIIYGDVVTDGKVEVRANWDEPEATLYWRATGGAPVREEDADRERWQPSIYSVGDFEHDHERALRVMSALWHFMHGSSRAA